MEPTSIALAILLLPLAAFVALLVGGRRLPREGDFVPTLAMGTAALLASKLFFGGVLGGEAGMAPSGVRWPWFHVGAWRFDFGVWVDDASAIMLFVVTTVSFLVHVYSTAYMRDHEGRPERSYGRFFVYLSLFTFAMLLIVVTDSLFFLYAGWELVGVTSYLLIGFHQERPAAARASAKAFLVNRVGDAGFFIGIALVLSQIGSFDMAELFASIRDGAWTPGLLTATALALFCGAVAKSAQFPLHVWLPDAMEGPTPVSALIHAATMVAAGVYMVLRLYPVFAGQAFFEGDLVSSPALWVVAGTGCATALLGATIAVVQTDLKRALAYSTVSQLGFMLAGLGVGAYAGGLFHLFTHAWFKAALFLGAGAVHHAAQTYEMPSMGGLRRRMPVTFATYLVACCAIAGVPPLAGFWSKESIVGDALAFGALHGSLPAMLPAVLLLGTAGLTAYYMFRTLFLVFYGEPREPERFSHAHEQPAAMTGPLVALALCAVLAGGVTSSGAEWFEKRVSPRIVEAYFGDAVTGDELGRGWIVHEYLAEAEVAIAKEKLTEVNGPLARHMVARERTHGAALLLSLAAAALGIFAAWALHLGPWREAEVVGITGALASLRGVLVNLYFIDWFYTTVIAGAARGLSAVAGAFDRLVVDGLVNVAGRSGVLVAKVAGVFDYWTVDGAVRALGLATLAGGAEARRVQTGRLQEYVYMTVLLVALIFGAWAAVEIYA